MEQKERLEQLHEQLEHGVEALTSGEGWKSWLRVVQNMPRYSFNNQILLMLQAPEATQVAGFNKWKQLGRSVRKGEKALWVLGPVTYKREPKEGERPEDIPTNEKRLRGFKPVPVFAIEQTDGPELPVPQNLTGEAPAVLWDELAKFVESKGYVLLRRELPGGLDGYTDPGIKGNHPEVSINSNRQPLHQLVTLIHEAAHIELEHVKDLESYRSHRGLQECEAESVAWVVSQAAGLDSSTNSFAYIGGWLGGDSTKIRATAQRVIAASRVLVEACPSLPPGPLAVEQSASVELGGIGA